mmetsp:Transcript_4267/g.12040  ORF Transcript_4267/g.12040 Transcript_4267/m.12040 type:complete len:237 (+) Transcript_4267:186-896(+)
MAAPWLVHVLPSVEAGALLRIREHLVGLSNIPELLLSLGLLFICTLGLVRVVELGQLAVLPLDGGLVGPPVHLQDLVVVLPLAHLQEPLSFLENLVHLAVATVALHETPCKGSRLLVSLQLQQGFHLVDGHIYQLAAAQRGVARLQGLLGLPHLCLQLAKLPEHGKVQLPESGLHLHSLDKGGLRSTVVSLLHGLVRLILQLANRLDLLVSLLCCFVLRVKAEHLSEVAEASLLVP